MEDPITFYNRLNGRVETEAVYGDAWLRRLYGVGPFAAATRGVVARGPWFSRWYGWRMRRPATRKLVAPFIRDYGVDVDELADSPDSYPSFNAFFIRRLKPEARPVAPGEGVAVFPADGRHLGFANSEDVGGVYVKGQRLDLRQLRIGPMLERFIGGAVVISRLCPVDYHRFHFPVAGLCTGPSVVPGAYYSVSPIALRRDLGHLFGNVLNHSLIASEAFGEVLMLEVGATCVASIVQPPRTGEPVSKGQEKGYFEFGGSCVMTLFQPGRIRLAADLLEHTRDQREVYARMGDVLGTACVS